MENIEFLDKIAASAGFLGVISLGVAFVFYKLYTTERADRREAWKYHNLQVETSNKILAENNQVIESLIHALEELKYVVQKENR
jgi:hypothetical protein